MASSSSSKASKSVKDRAAADRSGSSRSEADVQRMKRRSVLPNDGSKQRKVLMTDVVSIPTVVKAAQIDQVDDVPRYADSGNQAFHSNEELFGVDSSSFSSGRLELIDLTALSDDDASVHSSSAVHLRDDANSSSLSRSESNSLDLLNENSNSNGPNLPGIAQAAASAAQPANSQIVPPSSGATSHRHGNAFAARTEHEPDVVNIESVRPQPEANCSGRTSRASSAGIASQPPQHGSFQHHRELIASPSSAHGHSHHNCHGHLHVTVTPAPLLCACPTISPCCCAVAHNGASPHCCHQRPPNVHHACPIHGCQTPHCIACQHAPSAVAWTVGSPTNLPSEMIYPQQMSLAEIGAAVVSPYAYGYLSGHHPPSAPQSSSVITAVNALQPPSVGVTYAPVQVPFSNGAFFPGDEPPLATSSPSPRTPPPVANQGFVPRRRTVTFSYESSPFYRQNTPSPNFGGGTETATGGTVAPNMSAHNANVARVSDLAGIGLYPSAGLSGLSNSPFARPAATQQQPPAPTNRRANANIPLNQQRLLQQQQDQLSRNREAQSRWFDYRQNQHNLLQYAYSANAAATAAALPFYQQHAAAIPSILAAAVPLAAHVSLAVSLPTIGIPPNPAAFDLVADSTVRPLINANEHSAAAVLGPHLGMPSTNLPPHHHHHHLHQHHHARALVDGFGYAAGAAAASNANPFNILPVPYILPTHPIAAASATIPQLVGSNRRCHAAGSGLPSYAGASPATLPFVGNAAAPSGQSSATQNYAGLEHSHNLPSAAGSYAATQSFYPAAAAAAAVAASHYASAGLPSYHVPAPELMFNSAPIATTNGPFTDFYRFINSVQFGGSSNSSGLERSFLSAANAAAAAAAISLRSDSYTVPQVGPYIIVDRNPFSAHILQHVAEAMDMPQGASQNIIDQCTSTRSYLPRKDGEDERCAVCLSEFELQEEIRSLPCMHIYHIPCIDRWLCTNKRCPICREEIDRSVASASASHYIAGARAL